MIGSGRKSMSFLSVQAFAYAAWSCDPPDCYARWSVMGSAARSFVNRPRRMRPVISDGAARPKSAIMVTLYVPYSETVATV